MRKRCAMLAAVVLATGLGFAAASDGRVEPSGTAGQRSAASTAQKPAAVSMVVYKSPT